uniref:Tetraspanin n=1 Tax=Heterorhabditis bacteriophora TaxID=37862 RepID=A0A1I7X2X4_HETBA
MARIISNTKLRFIRYLGLVLNAVTMYMICIFFVSLLSAAGGWLGYHFNREIRSGDVQLWMKSGLKFEYGNPSVPYFKDAWDNLQRRYKCCGVSTEHSASEWLTSQWFKDLKIWPRPRVPESCCTTCETIYQM